MRSLAYLALVALLSALWLTAPAAASNHDHPTTPRLARIFFAKQTAKP
jgi:hypothetical protein